MSPGFQDTSFLQEQLLIITQRFTSGALRHLRACECVGDSSARHLPDTFDVQRMYSGRIADYSCWRRDGKLAGCDLCGGVQSWRYPSSVCHSVCRKIDYSPAEILNFFLMCEFELSQWGVQASSRKKIKRRVPFERWKLELIAPQQIRNALKLCQVWQKTSLAADSLEPTQHRLAVAGAVCLSGQLFH